MSDELIFFLILIALYIEENSVNCSIWEVFFQRGIFSKFSVCGNFARKRSRGLAFLLPSFFAPSFASAEDNLSFDENGISNLRLSAYPILRGSSQSAVFIKFSDILKVETKENFLLINEKQFAYCVNSKYAKNYKNLIETLKNSWGSERQKVLETYLNSRFDSAKANEVLRLIKSQIMRLRIVSALHFFAIFIAFPIAYLLRPELLFFAMGLIFCALFSLLLIPYFCIEKYKAEKKWKAFALKCIFFFPFLSVISREIYWRKLDKFHPALLAGILLKNKASKNYLSSTLRDLKYPIIRLKDSNALTCAKSFNNLIFERTLNLANKIFKTENFDFEILKINFTKDIKCYCPRCGSAFCTEKEICSDCTCKTKNI